ncbi:transcriptional regulator, LacI family [Tessaracoccus bendigoensis DSM 12906]|uniref:Transcriptional regulator, LacI family n=1 Tax=Tessaracoccus bendigoensis DSM 12906 TaxID=1123357 RepID=A0A1M6KJV3_9ACTN|nr:LacI family DNA-binding transcriptional regulator [Tessaracoccus bendigoensis]SHJ59232.1 transcriptional regulator, LacI family [Tessaracoccus bendigoensis DSM 12906]
MSTTTPISMADVARHAGVSAQTVSRVSNGAPGVKGPTRERVLRAMRELKYRPNSAARALKRGSFRSIAVVLSDLSSTGNLRTLRGVVEAAAASDYSVTVRTLGALTNESLRGAFDRLSESAVDAAVLLVEMDASAELNLDTLPLDRLVIVDSHAATAFPVVDSDQAAGARQAVDHLLALGHRGIHHVSGPARSFSSRARAAAWRERIEERGLYAPDLIQGDWSAESGYQAGHRLADLGSATAVFVANDEMALGLLRAFGERGVRVPEDISVIGFDDIELAPNFPVPLTTVHQDFDRVGALCVETVLRQIDSGVVTPGLTVVPTRLVVRASTSAPD